MTLTINILTVLNQKPTSLIDLLSHADITRFDGSNIHKEFVLAQLECAGLVGCIYGMYFCPNIETALAYI